jgi:hypothetical protein
VDEHAAETLPESELNGLLRRVDWRFLCNQREQPSLADLSAGRDSRALALVSRGAPVPGAADIAVTGFPTRLALGAARDAVRLGGEVVCLWRVPRLGGPGRAAARLRRAGLLDVRLLWPGPDPRHPPQFWLPLGAPAATAHLLDGRPARGPLRRLQRRFWRLALRTGLLAPVCAIGRVPGAEPDPADAELAAVLPAEVPTLLLSGGRRSINKVAALPFPAGGMPPEAVVKFARVAAADAALEREAEALVRVEREHPQLEGVPRVLASGSRWGRRALAESAVHGRPLIEELAPERLAPLGERVGQWLAGLVGDRAQGPETWHRRLVAEPLLAFEREFGDLAGAATVARARELLGELGPLPAACEHRDCSPWNFIVTAEGGLGLLDWESAEPEGLPALDLVYFLANAAFVIDGALESGKTRTTYRRLLDPAGSYGATFAACTAAYCERAGVPPAALPGLRLLCWLVHCRSDYRHLEMAAAGPPSPEALRGSMFFGLVEEELEQAKGKG